MKGICSQPPSFDAPLGYKLPFKAVMFQGMRSGDELLMSMRITACLDLKDCQVSANQCSAASGNLIRRKRDLPETSEKAAQNHMEMSEISKISFRVIMPGEDIGEEGVDNALNPTAAQSKSMILIGSLGFVGLLVALGIFITIKLKK